MSLAASYRQARQYQRTQVETASPVRLVVMLYDGAIRFLTQALERMDAKDLEGRHTNLIKAQNILLELSSTLDSERGGLIAANLRSLYAFMLKQLVEANLHDKQQPIHDVIGLLRQLREAWGQIEGGTSVEGVAIREVQHAA